MGASLRGLRSCKQRQRGRRRCSRDETIDQGVKLRAWYRWQFNASIHQLFLKGVTDNENPSFPLVGKIHLKSTDLSADPGYEFRAVRTPKSERYKHIGCC